MGHYYPFWHLNHSRSVQGFGRQPEYRARATLVSKLQLPSRPLEFLSFNGDYHTCTLVSASFVKILAPLYLYIDLPFTYLLHDSFAPQHVELSDVGMFARVLHGPLCGLCEVAGLLYISPRGGFFGDGSMYKYISLWMSSFVSVESDEEC